MSYTPMSSISARKKIMSPLILLLTYGSLLVHAITLQPRTSQGCVFLETEAKIYCYGGQGYSSNNSDAVVAIGDQYFFSLSLTKDTTITSIQSLWEGVNRNVGPNYYFAMTAIPSEGRIYMDGGAGAGNNGITISRYQAATFNANGNNSDWVEVTPFRDGGRVRAHTATLGKDNNIIYVWGGLRDANTGVTVGQHEDSPEMFLFDIINSRWTTGKPATNTYRHHAAVLVDSTIYYIGGSYRQPNGDIGAVEMSRIKIYDTINGQWDSLPTTGASTPSSRIRHTATLKPRTKEIIVFGGQNRTDRSDIRKDYFYILNTKTMLWSIPTLANDGDSFTPSGIRGHSAVLVKDNLFIMFGATLEGTAISIRNRTWVMDVERWAWVGSIKAVLPEATPSVSALPTTTGLPLDNNSQANNSGTIAGAVVGAVAGVAIIAGAIFFFIRRNRQKTQNIKDDHTRHKEKMLPPEDDAPPYSKIGYNLYNNRQSTSASTPELLQSTGRGTIEHSTYTNNSTPHVERLSGFHTTASEKPDGFISSREIILPEVQHLVLAPVKPDGA